MIFSPIGGIGFEIKYDLFIEFNGYSYWFFVKTDLYFLFNPFRVGCHLSI